MLKTLTFIRHNAIALLALFVALGGTSYAALSLPAGSVGTKQLRNGCGHEPTRSRSGAVTAATWIRKSIAGHVADWAQIQRRVERDLIRPKRSVRDGLHARVCSGCPGTGRLPQNCVVIANRSNVLYGSASDRRPRETFGPDGHGAHSSLLVETFDRSGSNVPRASTSWSSAPERSLTSAAGSQTPASSRSRCCQQQCWLCLSAARRSLADETVQVCGSYANNVFARAQSPGITTTGQCPAPSYNGGGFGLYNKRDDDQRPDGPLADRDSRRARARRRNGDSARLGRSERLAPTTAAASTGLAADPDQRQTQGTWGWSSRLHRATSACSSCAAGAPAHSPPSWQSSVLALRP